MQDKSKKIVISAISIITLVLITVGVTYAVFTYTKLGTTENTVTTGTLKFLYTENYKGGTGISITDAFPISDTEGKTLTGDNNVFDFKVEGTNTGTEEIPYEVTLRKKSTSTLAESKVKVYLTDMTEDSDTTLVGPKLYSSLPQTNIDVGSEVEKTLYSEVVPGNTNSYLKEFRLRMWVDESSNQDDINGKTFTALVNVYSNVPLISEEEIASRNSTTISSLTVDGLEATTVTGQDYDYEIKVAEGTSSITINTETANTNATVTVEKIDSLAYQPSNIKKIATSKTFDLTDKDNYFKIIVTSENQVVTKEYKLKVEIATNLKNKILSTNTLIEKEPTLTDSSNNTNDESGLYKSTATNSGSPTYYFRGDVKNNYVSFAGFTWRVVRINEDGTVRLIMQDSINNGENYAFNSNYIGFDYMYYSNNEAKTILESWYKENITDKGYGTKVATGNYFCEQAKVKFKSGYPSGDAVMDVYDTYIPNFKCKTDGNGKGLVNSSVGMINYDEIVFAGGYPAKTNSSYYLDNNSYFWTMSPAATNSSSYALVWRIGSNNLSHNLVSYFRSFRAVLNLGTDISTIGSGVITDPYVIQ